MEIAFPFFPDKSSQPRELGLEYRRSISTPAACRRIRRSRRRSRPASKVSWRPGIRWRARRRGASSLGTLWNGGVVSTAGNLVFQGNGMGEFVAYRADTGERLWSAETQAGVLAAPISYAVDGEQYVAIEVGWGGAFGLAAGELARDSHVASNLPRVLVYKLGGTRRTAAAAGGVPAVLDPPPDTAECRDRGRRAKRCITGYCSSCHGDSATGSGVLPDLRYSGVIKSAEAIDMTVRQGAARITGWWRSKRKSRRRISRRFAPI